MLTGGCARTVSDASVADRHGSPEAELEFWDTLTTQRVISTNDALHGLLMLADERAGTFQDRLAAARRRGWVGGGPDPDPNASAAVGLIAVAVCDILDIRGGATMRLLGRSPRYCTREIVYLGLIPQRGERQALSGLEFIDLAGRIEDYRSSQAGVPGVSGGGGDA
jgi:hypothetical protein